MNRFVAKACRAWAHTITNVCITASFRIKIYILEQAMLLGAQSVLTCTQKLPLCMFTYLNYIGPRKVNDSNKTKPTNKMRTERHETY